MFPAFLATVLFALSAVSATRTARVLGATEANFFRLSLATILLGLWAHLAGQGWTGRAFPIFFLSGCVGFGLGDLALFRSLIHLGSRLAILLVHCLAAPMAAATEWIWLGTTLTPLQITGGAVILLGVCLALAPEKPMKRSAKSRALLFAGIVYGVTAAFGQAMGAVLSRKAIAMGHTAGESIDGMTAAYQRILGGLLIVTLSLLWTRRKGGGGTGGTPPSRRDDAFLRRLLFAAWSREGGVPPPPKHSLSQAQPGGGSVIGAEGQRKPIWPWVVLNALAGPTFGVSCYQWALKLMGTGLVLPVVALTPLAVMPLSRALEGDRPGYLSILGTVVAVIGVVILTRSS